jgi:hypothetical protein
VGHDYNFFIIPEDHDPEDIIKVTLEDLDDEQRKLVKANRDTFTKLCLESSSKTRGKVIQKNQLPTPFIMITSPTDGSVESSSTWNFQ